MKPRARNLEIENLGPLDDQLWRTLPRDAFAAAGKAGEDFAVPQANGALGEKPFARDFREVVVPVAGETDYVWRLALAFGDKGEGAN